MFINTNIHKNDPSKVMSSPFYEVFSFHFENACTKLVTLYRKSNYTYVIFEFVSTILLNECFIMQACKSLSITDLGTTYDLRD